MTLETQIANLVQSTTALTAAANTKKAQLDAAVAGAQQAQIAAAQTTSNINGLNAAASAAAIAAASSAGAAIQAREAALAAWAASTAPTEQLAAMSQQFHHGVAVALAAADTANDSDGGAWAEASQHTSWYHEALGGDRWIGQVLSQAAAWAAAGNAPGAVFQMTADDGALAEGKFYVTLTEAASNVVIRGISRAWPALPVAVAEANRVVIYDASAIGCPMWRVIDAVYDGVVMLSTQSSAIKDIALFDGKLVIAQGRTIANMAWTSVLDFAGDTVHILGYHSYANRRRICNIVTSSYAPVYQQGVPVNTVPTTDAALGHSHVAIAAAPGSNLDPCTGLPEYMVGIVDAGGVTVFYPDNSWGRFVDYVTEPTVVAFEDGKIIVSAPYADGMQVMDLPKGLQSVNTAILEKYGAPGTSGLTNEAANGHSILAYGRAGYGLWNTGLVLLRRNSLNFRAGMQAVVTNEYTTGWVVGSPVFAVAAEKTLGPVTTVVDRSGGPDLVVIGGVQRVTLADGSDVGVLSNFNYYPEDPESASRRIEQPYNAALDFGFDDFALVITADMVAPVWQALIHRTATKTGWGDTGFFMGMAGPGVTPAENQGKIIAHVGGLQLIGPYVAGTGVRTYELSRTAGVFSLRVDGVLYAQAESQQDMTAVGAVTTVGAYWHRQPGDVSRPAGANPSTRILTVVATRYAASEAQAIKQARDIRAIVGHKALLRGIGADVRSVTECPLTGRVAVGTTTSQNVYEGLVNVSGSDAGGEFTAVLPGLSVVASSWKGGTRIETPALKHRRRRSAAPHSTAFVVQLIATAGQRVFAAPSGHRIVQVAAVGSVRSVGETRDYQIKNDGFKEHAVFAAGLAADAVVQLTVVRK